MKDVSSWSDTICALATPPGVAGLAVLRVSGSDTVGLCEQLFTGLTPLSQFKDHTIHVGWWIAGQTKIDSVTVTFFRGPHSYTGEDVVEIGCHGGAFVVEQILTSLVDVGARVAEPGEFTRRAFLNGKLDLLQVEAVADIIHAQSRIGSQTAARQLAGGFTKRLEQTRASLIEACGLLEVELDFSEEGYEFVSRSRFEQLLKESIELAEKLTASATAADILRSGFFCSVVGFPNAGKSSLFNSILDRSRAIVSDIPGTTRDYVEDSIIIDGYRIGLFDTAGLRDTTDVIELEGIKLTSSVIEQSNIVLLVNDASRGFDHSDTLRTSLVQRFPDVEVVVVQNKMDLVTDAIPSWRTSDIPSVALRDHGVDEIKKCIRDRVQNSQSGISDALVNKRQAGLLALSVQFLNSAVQSTLEGRPADLIAIDVRSAIRVLGEITGETWTFDVLDGVFSRFCIGK